MENNNGVSPIPPMPPMFPQSLQNAAPIMMPQLSFDTGIVKSFFANVKATQVEKYTNTLATIAENQNRAVTATTDMIINIVSASARLGDVMGQYDHNNKMRVLEQQEKTMQVQMVFFQAKNEEMDFKMKERSFREMTGEPA